MRICTKCGSVTPELVCCEVRTVPQAYERPPPQRPKEDVQRQLFVHLPEQRKPERR